MRHLLFVPALLLISSRLFAQSPEYKPAYELPQSRQVVAMYIGALSCGPCAFPATKAAIRDMKGLIREQAWKEGSSFAAIAVSLDWIVNDGLKFLDSLGTFDEIVVGNNWVNQAAERFIWGDSSGITSMPQVVVFERSVGIGRRIEISPPHVLFRVSGSDKIREWVKDGAPLHPTKPTI